MKGHGNWERFLKTRREQMSLQFSRGAIRKKKQRTRVKKKQGTTVRSVNPREDDGKNPPGKHLQTYEGQESDQD